MTKDIQKGGLMEVKVLIKSIERLKTSTELKEEKDKEGHVVDRRLMTKIVFEAEVDPLELSNLHHLIAADAKVYVVMGSAQAMMEVMEREGVFAES